MSVDEKALAELADDVQAAEAGSNTDPKGQGGKPTISITSPAGIATTTPKTIFSYAGVNIDAVAQQHMQYAVGQRFTLNAGQGIGLFAQHGGLKAIAHHGALELQSQHGDTLIDSAQNIQCRAVKNVVIMGDTVTLIAKDGSFIKVGGGITHGTDSAVLLKASDVKVSGPETLSTSVPTFSEGSPDQKFVLRHGGAGSSIAANQRFEMTMTDGSTVTDQSDAQGLTRILQRDAMHMASIRILRDG